MTLFWQVLVGFMIVLSAVWLGFSEENTLASERIVRPELTVTDLPQGRLYTVVLPPGGAGLRPAVSDRKETVEAFAARLNQPLLVVNGGFFDAVNAKTTSFVTVDGQLVADPRQNNRLTDNPNLTPYLERIFNRSELRVYQCGSERRLDIVRHVAPVPAGCVLSHALGGGPMLWPQFTHEEEAFTARNAQGKTVRDAISICVPRARTALGMTADGRIIVMMAGRHPGAQTGGFTLQEVADLLKARGAVKALALDGGGSSGLVFDGSAYYGEFKPNGQPDQRPVKSVLVVPQP